MITSELEEQHRLPTESHGDSTQSSDRHDIDRVYPPPPLQEPLSVVTIYKAVILPSASRRRGHIPLLHPPVGMYNTDHKQLNTRLRVTHEDETNAREILMLYL